MSKPDRPKRFVLEFVSGAPPIELDEVVTKELYKRADEEGVDPGVFLRADIVMRHTLMSKGWLRISTLGRRL